MTTTADLKAQVQAGVMARGGKQRGNEIDFRCPAHDDDHASANYNVKKAVWHCFGCGESGNYWHLGRLLGLVHNGHRPDGYHETRRWDIGGVATHRRFDRDGSKKIVEWERNGKPTLDGMRTDDLPLYGADLLPGASPDAVLLVNEGEKATDALLALGFTAVGTVTGAQGTPSIETLKPLADHPGRVILCPDNDQVGRDHMKRIAASLKRLGKETSIVLWPGVPEKGDAYDYISSGHTADDVRAVLESKPAEVDLGGLLADVEKFICRYVSTGEAESTAIMLWVAHTHAIEAAECTPYLYVTSAEKQSGKTRLLEVLQLLVARPWFTSRVSAAVLVRKVSRDVPTLLLDETDSAFKADKEYSEALRGILNAGYRRGGVASLCVKKGGEFDLVDFPVFCAKALAGIGQLPDTIADRSIRINMKRRSPGDKVERFRLLAAQDQASPLRERLEQWANVAVTRLVDAHPVLPEELSDRAADVWEPLFAEADMAGGEWPRRARQAAGVLSDHAVDDGLSYGSQLLRDIALVMNGRKTISSGELATALVEMEESPWGDLRGRPLDARKLAKMLKPYDIRPHTVRLGDKTPKGYQSDDFKDAFARYTPVGAATSDTTDTKNTPKANSLRGEVKDVAEVADVAVAGGYTQEVENTRPCLNDPSAKCHEGSSFKTCSYDPSDCKFIEKR